MISLFLFQDVDAEKSPRVTSADPGAYLREHGENRVLSVVDAVFDGTMIDTVQRQLVAYGQSLRGQQGREFYVQINFRSR